MYRAKVQCEQRCAGSGYISTGIASIHSLLSQLTTALANLENKRVAYNKKAKSTEPFLKELTRINSEIAHYDVIDLAGQYDKQ